LRSQLLQGYLLLAMSSVSFSVMSVFVRMLGRDRSYEAVCIRFVFGIVVIVALCQRGWARLRPVNWPLLAVRGAMGGGAVLCYFLAIGHVGLAEGSVLSFAFPIFTAICAWLFLDERPTVGICGAIVVSFAGMYLVLWPKDWSGVVAFKLLALAGALMAGIAVAAIRRLRRTDSSYTILLSQCLFGLLIVAAPAATKNFDFDLRGWMLLLAIGMFATAGQLVMTFAFKFVPATQGSIFSFCTPVLNVVAGACLFHEAMPVRSWMGSALVIGACVYVSLAKHPPASAGVQRM